MKKYLYYEGDTVILISDEPIPYLVGGYVCEELPEEKKLSILKLDKNKKPYYEPIPDPETVMEAKLKAATDRQDFIEDLIAEMAMKVYE